VLKINVIVLVSSLICVAPLVAADEWKAVGQGYQPIPNKNARFIENKLDRLSNDLTSKTQPNNLPVAKDRFQIQERKCGSIRG